MKKTSVSAQVAGSDFYFDNAVRSCDLQSLFMSQLYNFSLVERLLKTVKFSIYIFLFE